jgi:hypothetical protein
MSREKKGLGWRFGASEIIPLSLRASVIFLSESKILAIIRSLVKIDRFNSEVTIFIQGYLSLRVGKTIMWSKWEWRMIRWEIASGGTLS